MPLPATSCDTLVKGIAMTMEPGVPDAAVEMDLATKIAAPNLVYICMCETSEWCMLILCIYTDCLAQASKARIAAMQTRLSSSKKDCDNIASGVPGVFCLRDACIGWAPPKE